MTVLGVKTPEDGNPPPLLGTRFGDPSKFQRLDIPGGFHCGWDVWEKTGAPVLAPLPGTVIESRDRNTVSEDYNMAVQLELRLPRRAENGSQVVYMQVLHAQAHSMLPLGKRVEPGDRVCRVGFFGMQRIGNPHAHIEFFGLSGPRSTTITGGQWTLIGFGATFSLSALGSFASPRRSVGGKTASDGPQTARLLCRRRRTMHRSWMSPTSSRRLSAVPGRSRRKLCVSTACLHG
jgi:murein DD-endopeptidase MepM/ murein hydrolase activator NlpD